MPITKKERKKTTKWMNHLGIGYQTFIELPHLEEKFLLKQMDVTTQGRDSRFKRQTLCKINFVHLLIGRKAVSEKKRDLPLHPQMLTCNQMIP